MTNNQSVKPEVGGNSAIFAGMSPAEIWVTSKGGSFPGGHFYLQNILTGDGFTQFGLALGCGVALPALVGSSISFARAKSFGFVALSLWVSFMVFFSAAGLVSLH